MTGFVRLAGWLLALGSAAAMAAPNGTPDLTFGSNFGHQLVGFDLGGSLDDDARALAVGQGGRLYLVGSVEIAGGEDPYSIGISRLLPDGAIDETFGVKGKVVYHEPAYQRMRVTDAAFQADGKLVVVGSRRIPQPYNIGMMVCRFEASGAIDPTFGQPTTPGCRVIPSPVGIISTANSVVIQSNDRIVVAGYMQDQGDSVTRGVVARMMPNGAMDSSFGNQGAQYPGTRIVFPDAMQEGINFLDIAQGPDEQLVVVGTIDYQNDGKNYDIVVAKLERTNGALDTDFAEPNGYLLNYFDLGGSRDDTGGTVQVLPDGAILVGADATLNAFGKTIPAALKFDSTGAPYPGWTNGKKYYNACLVDCIMETHDLQVADDGSFVIAGTRSVDLPATKNFFAMRFLPDGAPDPSFGMKGGLETGLTTVDFTGDLDEAYRTVLQGERVLIAGTANISGNDEFAIVRLDHGIPETLVVTPQSGPGGKLSPEVAQNVAYSDQLDFVATPDPTFSLLQVSGCGGKLFEGIYTTAPATEDCVVTAEFSSSPVLTYSAGPNGSIEGLSPQIVPLGENAKPVDAIGDAGYHFTQWSDGSLDNPRQDLNVTQSIDVTALFDINLYEVVPNPDVGGVMSPDEVQMVPHGGHTQFVIQPDPGFAINEFSGCSGSLQGNIYTTDAIFEGCKASVSFIASNQMYSLEYLPGSNGSIDGTALQSVLAGADGSAVTAVPNLGYHFVAWSDGMSDNPRQDTHVVGDIAVSAIFAKGEFTVTPSATPGGTISPATAQQVPAGKSAEFTLTANMGFVLQGVGGTCGGSLVGNIFKTNAITQDCSVIATFAISSALIFSDGLEESP